MSGLSVNAPAALLHSLAIGLIIFLAWLTAAHALLNKREDPRATLGWVAVCLLFPFIGPILYFLFGINRIQSRARKLQRIFAPPVSHERCQWSAYSSFSPPLVPSALATLAQLADAVSERPLVGGNRIELLCNGEQAYPAMLEAIDSAAHSLLLATYIFESNDTGQQFVNALARAVERGVDVRVMVDGIGELYTFPRISRLLRKRSVPVARFLPPRLLPPELHINLRNHCKICVADERIGFTGGMNIGDRHLVSRTENTRRVADVHFQLTGPVVAQMVEVFLEDWQFVTGDERPLAAAPALADADGTAICRTITDGPDKELDRLAMILAEAVSAARHRIDIMTPYFLPPRELMRALQAASLRGVEVNVILPERNNLPLVHWATRNTLPELLEQGVRVLYQPPPFAHTKLFLIDNQYAQIGSANLDPRSLRLNFELAIESYDQSFAHQIAAYYQRIHRRCRKVMPEELQERHLPARIRDALAWLFSPYL
ncbi:MAG: cardiolipin synthase [Gammaproteobacteria bacterium]|jgi:cardiolipin synthase